MTAFKPSTGGVPPLLQNILWLPITRRLKSQLLPVSDIQGHLWGASSLSSKPPSPTSHGGPRTPAAPPEAPVSEGLHDFATQFPQPCANCTST